MAVALVISLLLTTGALQTPKNWGIQQLPGHGQHWTVSDARETELLRHNVSDAAAVGITTHFWSEFGRGPQGRYLCDTMIIRYYVDGEVNASLAFTPSMAAGSGVGLEPLAYYRLNQSAVPRGASNCSGGSELDQCGMDLADGWPWQTRWTGKGGSEGNWILKLRVPFTQSLRVTAQVASSAPNIDPAFSRPDIAPGTTVSGFVMLRGLEGAEESVRVALGLGSLLLPPIRSSGLRLRLQRLHAHAPAVGEFVPLARYAGGSTSGALLMLTVSLQGMHTVPADVEMCWWALTTATAAYNSSRGEHLLIGTGMEDFFGNSFSLSRLTRTYFLDDAGVTHVHGGQQDVCPSAAGGSFPTCSDDFRTRFPSRFSAYRFFDKDPLVFDDRLDLSVRYAPAGGPGKCSLAPYNPEPGSPAAASTGAPPAVPTRFDAYAWFYTYQRT